MGKSYGKELEAFEAVSPRSFVPTKKEKWRPISSAAKMVELHQNGRSPAGKANADLSDCAKKHQKKLSTNYNLATFEADHGWKIAEWKKQWNCVDVKPYTYYYTDDNDNHTK